MRAWQATVQDEAGNAVFNPQVTVYEEDGVTLANIYNEDGSPKENPFTGTTEGFAQFWADRGTYRVVGADGNTISERWQVDLADEEALEMATEAQLAAGPTPQMFGDGSAGWQVPINAAIDALHAQGGGRLVVPPLSSPYEITAPIVIKSHVHIDFGKAQIKLANGANCDMIQTDGFYSLTGTNNYAPDGSPRNFTITGGVFDGNFANQSPANPDTCNGLALYGYGFTARDMEVRNIRGHGLRMEWGQYGGEQIGHSMESFVENCRFDTSGRHGIWYQGPHDGCFSHIIVINPSQEADNTYDGIYCGSTGGARWFNPHVWHRSGLANRARWSANFTNGGNEVTTGHFEGGRKQLRVTGNCDVRGVQIYAPNSNDPQIEVSGERNVISGRFRYNAAFPRPTVLTIGATSSAAVNTIDLRANVNASGPSNPLVTVINSTGSNNVTIRGAGADVANYFTGAWDNFDDVDLAQEFPALYRYRQTAFNRSGTSFRPTVAAPGQQHFDTTLNKPIWRNAANTAWVDATGTTV